MVIGPIIQQERQSKYTSKIDETRSRSHCCRGKAISSIYSECVLVALVFQRAKGMRLLHCYPWPVWLYPHYPITGMIFEYIYIYWTWNVCFDFSTDFVWKISYFKRNSAGWLATGWTVRGPNPGVGKIFRTCPDLPWGPPSLLYNGYRVFSGGKAAWAWRWPPTPIQRRG